MKKLSGTILKSLGGEVVQKWLFSMIPCKHNLEFTRMLITIFKELKKLQGKIELILIKSVQDNEN